MPRLLPPSADHLQLLHRRWRQREQLGQQGILKHEAALVLAEKPDVVLAQRRSALRDHGGPAVVVGPCQSILG